MRERCSECGQFRNSFNLFSTEDGVICGKCMKEGESKWDRKVHDDTECEEEINA